MNTDLRFIDPTARRNKSKIELAPRSMDIAGKVVGLLDNNKEQGSLILETLGKALVEKYGAARVVMRSKPHYSKPATEELINEMANEVDVAIAAVGG
jgi:hypothetical protein